MQVKVNGISILAEDQELRKKVIVVGINQLLIRRNEICKNKEEEKKHENR